MPPGHDNTFRNKFRSSYLFDYCVIFCLLFQNRNEEEDFTELFDDSGLDGRKVSSKEEFPRDWFILTLIGGRTFPT